MRANLLLFVLLSALISLCAATNSTNITSAFDPNDPPDVYLNVSRLSVDEIDLTVSKLTANINLNANVANLVSINAGVAVSIGEVNLTIKGVDAQLALIVRLGHLVDIVNRVFSSLDLNPLILGVLNDVTSVVNNVVDQLPNIVTSLGSVVTGLLGSVTQGTSTIQFLIDDLGNIVQNVVGSTGTQLTTPAIIGNYKANMTSTGVQQVLSNGNVLKQFSYGPLNALVNIVFTNSSLTQIVSTSVVSAANAIACKSP